MINSNNYFMGLNVKSKKDYKEVFGNQSENGLKLMMKGSRKINSKDKSKKSSNSNKLNRSNKSKYKSLKKYPKLSRKIKMSGGYDKNFQNHIKEKTMINLFLMIIERFIIKK